MREAWPVAAVMLVLSAGAYAEDRRGELLEIVAGTFIGEDATAGTDDQSARMMDSRVPVQVPALGSHVMYWEVRTGSESKVYRRLLARFETDDDSGGILQTNYKLRTGVSWPEDPAAPGAFAGLAADAFEPALPPGCVSLWRPTAHGWAAYMDPDSCRVYSERRKVWRRIEAESEVTETALRQTERGFDDDGNQLFGTPPGEYHKLSRLDRR